MFRQRFHGTEERTGRKSEKECENRRRDEYRILDGTWNYSEKWQEEIIFLPFVMPREEEWHIWEIIIIVKNIGRVIVRIVLRC